MIPFQEGVPLLCDFPLTRYWPDSGTKQRLQADTGMQIVEYYRKHLPVINKAEGTFKVAFIERHHKRRIENYNELLEWCNTQLKLPEGSQFKRVDCVTLNLDHADRYLQTLAEMQTVDVLVSSSPTCASSSSVGSCLVNCVHLRRRFCGAAVCYINWSTSLCNQCVQHVAHKGLRCWGDDSLALARSSTTQCYSRPQITVVSTVVTYHSQYDMIAMMRILFLLFN